MSLAEHNLGSRLGLRLRDDLEEPLAMSFGIVLE